jgi:hypothetical protein
MSRSNEGCGTRSVLTLMCKCARSSSSWYEVSDVCFIIFVVWY